ncbi:ABC transporter permease [Acrocarpospora pleiomorpha]|uniref:ABC transporter permease n=1 Tax=Acrocarpospora pleiomorpha TaxID=90975 RepID=A0A5M3Y1G8_9ACTN|nr:ABC transporter permease [Acrocarpospora pleiomorpha]GES27046.1 ABC transporter permease [Acrocarpospora pleiomorpha]
MTDLHIPSPAKPHGGPALRDNARTSRGALRAPLVISISGIAGLLALWELIVHAFDIPGYLLAGPWEALAEIAAAPGFYWEHSLMTLEASALGFGAGGALGVIFGAVIFYVPAIRHVLYPSLIAVNTIPKVAIAPLFIVWFGFGLESKSFVALSIAFFPLVISTFDGLASVPSELRELARINRASKWNQMRKIELIHCLPSIFTGMKISISMAVGGAVVGEFIAGNSGLGFVILVANSQVNLTSMFAAFICLAVMSLALFMVVDHLGRILLPWNVATSK